MASPHGLKLMLALITHTTNEVYISYNEVWFHKPYVHTDTYTAPKTSLDYTQLLHNQ